MPACWFCGEDVPRLHICVKCEQEFCDQHIATVNHDCAGVPVPNPFKVAMGTSPVSLPAGGTRFQCWFCGSITPETVQCAKCGQRFCASHAKPEDHDCLGDIIPNPLGITTPFQGTGDPNIGVPPEILLYRAGKIELDSQRAEQFAATVLDAYHRCVEEPGKSSEVDSELGEIYLLNPNVIWIINSRVFNDQYAEKLNQDPLARNLMKWLKAFGSRLEFIQQISDDLQIPAKELTLQQLLYFHFSYLTDFSQFLAKMVAIQADHLDQPLPPITIQDVVKFEAQSLGKFAEQAYQAGDREIGVYLVGTRDASGKIEKVQRYISLNSTITVEQANAIPGQSESQDLDECDPLLRDFFRIMEALVVSDEVIVGFMHSRPQGFFPSNTREDVATHLKEKIFASIFHSNLPIQPSDKIHLVSHLSKFNFLQIANLLLSLKLAANDIEIFDQVVNAIFQHHPNQWAELQNQLEFLLGVTGEKVQKVDFELVPYLSVVVAPVMRFVNVVDYVLAQIPDNPRTTAIKEVFYNIEIVN